MNRLGLFKRAADRFFQRRTLYTDHIYPYPFNYINNKLFPSRPLYRETWEYPWWSYRDHDYFHRGMKMFWTWWWYQVLWHPEFYLGHGEPPDPSTYTDEELGIPPDEYGPYSEWLEKRQGESY